MSPAPTPAENSGRRAMIALGAILVLALALRLVLVVTTVYLWDEDREWIVLASSISFDPASLHLPVQGDTHPVLPAYLMRLGTLIFGENPLGYRFFSLVAGVLTVLVAFRLARRLAGETAGLVAAAVLAVCEYHVVVSSVAVDMVFYLLFAALALSAFVRFLQSPAPRPLALTALCIGLGYLCNERAGLLLPICGVFLLTRERRAWLRRWETWASLALFLVVISPDLLKGWLAGGGSGQAGFGDHLARLSGIGLTAQPLAFYGKGAVKAALTALGTGFKDWAPEYPAMNVVLGAVLLLGVAAAALRPGLRRRSGIRLLLLAFGAVFALLVLLDTEFNEERGLGPQAWYWADLTLLPAALLAGASVSSLRGWRRGVLVLLLAGGCLVSVARLGWGGLTPPRYKAGAEPVVIWPADGRSVEVRTGFLACWACDPEPEVELERINLERDGRWRDALPGELVPADPGGLRSVRLPADEETRTYGLHYLVREDSGRESRVAVYVLVRDEPPRGANLFWLEEAVAAGRP